MSERKEQEKLFQWVILNEKRLPAFKLIHASMVGTNLHVVAAMAAKRGGVRRGWPDISWPVARGPYHGLYIEMKWGRNKQTPEQIEYQNLLEYNRNKYVVCYTAEEAIKEIQAYNALLPA